MVFERGRKRDDWCSTLDFSDGHLPSGPLAILKESWYGDEHLPVSFGKNASDYLTELHRKLEIAKTYAASHTEREQQRYVSHYRTNFTSQLTREFERRMGCSPRFNSPYHPSSTTGLAERAVGNVKTIIGKLAIEHPRDWHNVLLWSCGV